MLDGADKSALLDEAPYQGLDIGEIATAITAHIDDESVTGAQISEHMVEVAVADGIGKAFVAHVAEVVVEDGIFDARRLAVVEVEVVLVDEAFVVVDGVLFPYPVARHVVRSDEVGVPVTQFLEHVTTQLKQLLRGHVLGEFGAVALPHLIPVDIFLLEEAIMLVHNGPQGVKVAPRIIVPLRLIVTGRERHSC